MSRTASLLRWAMLISISLFINASSAEAQSTHARVWEKSQAVCQYLLPWSNIEGKILVTQGNMESQDWSHEKGRLLQYAVDFGIPKEKPVLASRGGIVSKVHDGETDCGGVEKINNANFVIVGHPDGEFSLYLHLKNGIPVSEGQEVARGQIIGYVGNTGWTNCGANKNRGYHLHYQLQRGGDKIVESAPLCFAEVPGGVPKRGDLLVSQNQITTLPPEPTEPEFPASLIGLWEGTVSTFVDGATQPPRIVRFEIRNECPSSELCAEQVSAPVSAVHPPVESEQEGYFCFGDDINTYCFKPVDNNTLHYAGGGMLWLEDTTLHRVQEGAIQTPSSPLNRFSQASVLEWLSYSLASGDLSVFDSLIVTQTIGYGTGLAGGRSEITKAEFLTMLQERIINAPACLGYSSPEGLWVWTGNWKPGWVYQDAAPQSELTLWFHNSTGGFYLGAAYFTPASAVMEVPSVNAKLCPTP